MTMFGKKSLLLIISLMGMGKNADAVLIEQVSEVSRDGSSCQNWCGTSAKAWSAKCKWAGCSDCGECDNVLECKGWCGKNAADWDTKCNYNACEGCPECPTEAPTASPTGCKGWCGKSDKDWATKCGFSACAGCSACFPANPTEAPTANPTGCKGWCGKSDKDWAIKCGFSACGGCPECDSEAPTASPTEAASEAPTASPTEAAGSAAPTALPSSTMLIVSKENRYHRGCSTWTVPPGVTCNPRHSSTDCTGVADQHHCHDPGNYISHSYIPASNPDWRVDGASEETVTFYTDAVHTLAGVAFEAARHCCSWPYFTGVDISAKTTASRDDCFAMGGFSSDTALALPGQSQNYTTKYAYLSTMSITGNCFRLDFEQYGGGGQLDLLVFDTP